MSKAGRDVTGGRRSGVLLAVCLATASSLQAAEFNHKHLLTGQRAAGLGGAYVALADNNTGMFYNPAGMVHAAELQTSAAINLISASFAEYDKVFGNARYRRESLEIVPGFLGSMWQGGDLRFGASVVVVDSSNEDASDIFRDVRIGNDEPYDELFVQNDYQTRTYDLGFSVAGAWNPRLSWGATLYLNYRDKDASLLQRLSRNDPQGSEGQDSTAILVASNTEDTQFGIRPVLGLMYRKHQYSLGASVSRVYAISRDYRYNFIGDAQAGGNLAISFADTADQGLNGAWQLALAGAWFLPNSDAILTLQLEHFLPRPAAGSPAPGQLPPRDIDRHRVTNVAFGMEIPWNLRWSSRFGLYSDLANTEVAGAGPFERREEIDMYGISFSLSRRNSGMNWTVGAQVAMGEGQATLGDIGFGSAAADSDRVAAQRQRIDVFVNMDL